MEIKCRKDLRGYTLILSRDGIWEKDYQIKMMEQNEVEGILPLNMEGDGKKTWINFQAGGRKNLRCCLRGGMANKEMGERIIGEILCEAKILEEYMLSPGRLLLNTEMIFVEDEKLYFCYDPLGDDDFMGRFRSLAKELFCFSRSGEEAFFLRLQKLLLNDQATLFDLKALCKRDVPEKTKEESWDIKKYHDEESKPDLIEVPDMPEPEKKLSLETDTIPEEILNFDDDMEEEKGFLLRAAEKGIHFFREPFGKNR